MSEKQEIREARLRQSFIKHAALAQVYRWWQYADAPPEDPALLLGLLEKNATAAFGSAMHPHRVHCLGTPTLKVQSDGSVSISAEVERVSANSPSCAATLESTGHFHGLLRPTESVLPTIVEARIHHGHFPQTGPLQRAEAENRIRSLVHYFTALVENPRRDARPFSELLTPDFSLHFTEPPIDSLDALTAWVAGPLSSVVASHHAIGDIVFEPRDDREYAVTIGMRSEALFPDGSGIRSSNTQHWTVTDGNERFARIRTISIERHSLERTSAEA
jgi:hypothetical protein